MLIDKTIKAAVITKEAKRNSEGFASICSPDKSVNKFERVFIVLKI